MKKKIGIIFCLLLLLLTTACDGSRKTPTAHAEKDEYVVGEEIIVRDDKSNEVLGRVTITEVTLLRDEPFTVQRYSYKETYEAIVQIRFTASTVDSLLEIGESNFDIYDAQKGSAQMDLSGIYQSDSHDPNCIIFAVKEKGDHVKIDFSFHPGSNPITTITATYEQPEVLRERAMEKNRQVVVICAIMGTITVALTATVIVLACKKKKAGKAHEVSPKDAVSEEETSEESILSEEHGT